MQRPYPCSKCNAPLELNEERTKTETEQRGYDAPIYYRCMPCAGVPKIYHKARFSACEHSPEIIGKVGAFLKASRGVLFIRGDYGTGKSYLGAACVHEFSGKSLFIEAPEMLRLLRKTYHTEDLDPEDDIVERCRKAKLLIIDDIGATNGGKDEAQMLHAVLNYRYAELLPTVITSNLTLEQLQQIWGDRITDRLNEAMCGEVLLEGKSKRPKKQADYFKK